MMSSIRGRVLLFVLLAQLLATACAVSIAVWYVHRALWSSADSELQARAVSLLALVGQADNNPYALDFDGNQMSAPSDDLYYIVDPRGGPALAGSNAWIGDLARIRKNKRNTWTFQRGATTYRAKALIEAPILDQEDLKVPQLRANLFYAMPVTRTLTRIAQATRIAILVGMLSLLVSAFFTWWAIGKGMAPLVELASRADRIQAARAEFELPPGTLRSAELMPLGKALQSLAARVRAAFDRERQFLSDAAHELKTAVAIQKSTLQLLEQGKASETEYREGVARALEDTARMEQLVADMLLLSAIEHAQNSPENSGPAEDGDSLDESVQMAIDRLQPLAQMKKVVIDFKSTEDHRVKGKATELGVLWTNLIENAIQHSPPSSRVAVEVSGVGDSACLVRIVDTGSGIAPADLTHIFERFYRSDSSRSRATGGFGLGLSIAKAIVDGLRGSIRVESTLQKGTTVEVTLPCVSTEPARQKRDSTAG
jgi:signal transduction histidine kinase